MRAISPKFSQPGGPVLNLDDARGEGLPLIFQHGLWGDARQTIEAFPRDPHSRRITIESRGHGGSEAGDPRLFSIRTFTADIAAFIEAHRLAPIIIGGISMGAATTLHLAVHRPEIVRSLILVRPAWIAASAPANNSPNAQVGRLHMDLSQEDARKAFEVSETARLLAEIAPDNLASLRGFFSREPQATTAALLQAIAGDEPGVSEENLHKAITNFLETFRDVE
jgi:pimeloyl-ACP methyl ester carboxylesterase